jgi:hypothetical protein
VCAVLTRLRSKERRKLKLPDSRKNSHKAVTSRHFKIGLEKYSDGVKLEDTLKDIKQKISTDPENLSWRHDLGYLYYLKGQILPWRTII